MRVLRRTRRPRTYEEVDQGTQDSVTSKVQYVDQRLLMLLNKKAVAFQINDAAMRKKNRIHTDVLFLTPTVLYDEQNPYGLMVAVLGRGCEVIDTTQPLKIVDFVRAGLAGPAARVIVNQLSKVFATRRKGKNGNPKNTSARKTKRKARG